MSCPIESELISRLIRCPAGDYPDGSLNGKKRGRGVFSAKVQKDELPWEILSENVNKVQSKLFSRYDQLGSIKQWPSLGRLKQQVSNFPQAVKCVDLTELMEECRAPLT